MKEITAIDFYGRQISVNYDKDSDYCPACHKTISPNIIGAYLNSEGCTSDFLQIIFRCPNIKCGRVSFTYYRGNQSINGVYYNYLFDKTLPGFPKDPNIPESVKDISEKFYEIIKEANIAEAWGLKEIVGVGYRKALEFLIKDYLIEVTELDRDTVQKTWLSKCIKENIDSERIKNVAERVVWLGNDEAHYYRKWEEKDIQDLKTLLELTISFINEDILYRQYLEEMPGG